MGSTVKFRGFKDYGFFRVATAVPVVHVANPGKNADEIIKLIHEAYERSVQLVVFPELSVTGYTCEDLFKRKILLKAATEALQKILHETSKVNIISIVGMPLVVENRLFNVAVAIHRGTILGIVPKTHLPNSSEFYEKRWFKSATELPVKQIRLFGQTVPIGTDVLIDVVNIPNCRIGIEICEDAWVTIPPSAFHSLNSATIIANLSASDELVTKADYRRSMVNALSAGQVGIYMYCSAGFGESSKDVLYAGDAFVSENGRVIAESTLFLTESQLVVTDVDLSHVAFDRLSNSWADNANLFRREYRHISTSVNALRFDIRDKNAGLLREIPKKPFTPSNLATLRERCEEIIEIQSTALACKLRDVEKVIKRQVSIGISGGLDSTLAFLVTVRAFRKLGWSLDGIIAVTMPGFGTSKRTLKNAYKLCEAFGVTLREISIVKQSEEVLRGLGHEPCGNCLVCENVQARIRTVTLMALGFMINTGDLSETAQGWCTYAADQTGMYCVNISIPKTLVRVLVKYLADDGGFGKTVKNILYDILRTPVSPELTRKVQKTEDLIGPYVLHDFFLYHFLRWGSDPEEILFLAQIALRDEYEPLVILKWMRSFFRRFFASQFKRNANPDGIKVGLSLGQRGDWRMPSNIAGSIWDDQCAELEEYLKSAA